MHSFFSVEDHNHIQRHFLLVLNPPSQSMLNPFLILRFGLPSSPSLSQDSKITTNSHVNLTQTSHSCRRGIEEEVEPRMPEFQVQGGCRRGRVATF